MRQGVRHRGGTVITLDPKSLKSFKFCFAGQLFFSLAMMGIFLNNFLCVGKERGEKYVTEISEEIHDLYFYV